MSNATEENTQVQTDTCDVRPIKRHATYISRRPAWADETDIDSEAIVHRWTAPTVAEAPDADIGEAFPIPVEIMQVDDLIVMGGGVTLHPGETTIFVLDTNIRDTVNARKLAAAILECCDRIEASDR
jgi:hypothetical protein